MRSDAKDYQELLGLLINLVDTAQRLSPGPERAYVLEQIRSFHRRLAELLGSPQTYARPLAGSVAQ